MYLYIYIYNYIYPYMYISIYIYIHLYPYIYIHININYVYMYIHNWLVLWILHTSPTCFNRKGHLQVAIPEIQEEAAPPRVSSEPPWINEIHGMWIWDMLCFFDIQYRT